MKRVVPGVAIWMLLLCPAVPRAWAQGGGAVSGVIRDVHGTPQMGAVVELLSGEMVVARTFTDDHGRYQLESFGPGRFSLRASSTMALPALRPNLHLASGVRVLADLTVSAIYEVGIWFPAEKRGLGESPNDWRWTLRSSANRPLLRLQDAGAESEQADAAVRHMELTSYVAAGGVGASGTHQVFSFERERSLAALGASATRWAVDLLDPAAGSGQPGVSIRTGFSTESTPGSGSEITATYTSEPTVVTADGSNAQIVTLASTKQLTLGRAVLVDVGNLVTSEHLNGTRSTAAPYLRLAVAPADGFTVLYRLATDQAFQGREDTTSPILPEVLADEQGHPILLRRLHQELGLSHRTEDDVETIAVYQDDLPIEGLNGGGRLAPEGLEALPIVTDSVTGDFRIAVHGYTGRGVSASWTHRLAPEATATAVAECGTALMRRDAPLHLANAEAETHPGTAVAMTARVQGTTAKLGTAVRAQYRWQPRETLDAVDTYNADHDAYLSFSLRQQLWTGQGMRSVRAVVDVKNLLEQGYQPVFGPDGEMLFFAQAPRVMQAGLSFDF